MDYSQVSLYALTVACVVASLSMIDGVTDASAKIYAEGGTR